MAPSRDPARASVAGRPSIQIARHVSAAPECKLTSSGYFFVAS
jgi:hypothetical protein